MKVRNLLMALGVSAAMSMSAAAAEYVLKFSHVVSPNTPKGKAADFFEKRLEELSKGRIDVQVYPNSQLYKDNAVLKALKLDSVQMACPSFSKFGKIVPQLALFDLPFLFKDIDHRPGQRGGPEAQGYGHRQGLCGSGFLGQRLQADE